MRPHRGVDGIVRIAVHGTCMYVCVFTVCSPGNNMDGSPTSIKMGFRKLGKPTADSKIDYMHAQGRMACMVDGGHRKDLEFYSD